MSLSVELAVPVSAIDHVRGAPRARVTLVEYGDFECPNCKQAEPVLTLLLNRYTGELRVVYRHFPLEEVHSHALYAALAAEAAAGQEKFWPTHDVLFENQRHFKHSQIRGYAQRLELDMTRYDADMDDTVYLQRVREDIAGGRASGVRSTPTFFVNGSLRDVSFGPQHLAGWVEKALRG